nr:hypothetical protein CFP56_16735 [Quercus suber]
MRVDLVVGSSRQRVTGPNARRIWRALKLSLPKESRRSREHNPKTVLVGDSADERTCGGSGRCGKCENACEGRCAWWTRGACNGVARIDDIRQREILASEPSSPNLHCPMYTLRAPVPTSHANTSDAHLRAACARLYSLRSEHGFSWAVAHRNASCHQTGHVQISSSAVIDAAVADGAHDDTRRWSDRTQQLRTAEHRRAQSCQADLKLDHHYRDSLGALSPPSGLCILATLRPGQR